MNQNAKSSSRSSELLAGLRELSASSFPKRCATCGKVYPTAKAFIEQTLSLEHHSGLKASLDDNDETIVDVFRNCSCGSTLMDSFQDRRQSDNAQRREVFEKLLHLLEDEGLTRSDARQLLLDSLKGETHPMLESLGVKLKHL